MFFQLLEKALNNHELVIPEKDHALYTNLKGLKRIVYRQLWHVHIKKTFKGAGQVISYLGRYTHRVAIINSRLLSIDNSKVVQQKYIRHGGVRGRSK